MKKKQTNFNTALHHIEYAVKMQGVINSATDDFNEAMAATEIPLLKCIKSAVHDFRLMQLKGSTYKQISMRWKKLREDITHIRSAGIAKATEELQIKITEIEKQSSKLIIDSVAETNRRNACIA